MKLNRILFGTLAVAFASSAFAQTSASALITLTGTSGSLYNYDIDLTNLGANNSAGIIQTFWFAWIPDVNFMPDVPTNLVAPAGWTDSVTIPGGYGIQWVTTGGLAGGSSLDGFKFSSPDSPAVLQGNFVYFGVPYPILTSYVYSGQPFLGTFDQFLVAFNPAPEPASWLALGGLSLAAILVRRRRVADLRR